MTIHTALLQGRQLLEEAGIAVPRLTAEVLLAHAVGHDRAWLYAHSDDELREVWWIHYGRYLHQRLQGQPTQQITGVQEFYGRDFRVTPDVLIPRPETEHVIEAALKLGARNIVDIGTGSGAIAITLALETGARVVGTDISIAALGVAAANGRRLGAAVEWLACDLASALPQRQLRSGGLESSLCSGARQDHAPARGPRLRTRRRALRRRRRPGDLPPPDPGSRAIARSPAAGW